MEDENKLMDGMRADGITVRSLSISASSLDEKTRSIEGVFATEQPVMVYDWQRGDVINEILLADGYEYPEQIPFLDSHNRYSVKNQYGSARGMKIVNGALVGRVYFGATTDAEAAYTLAREKHITDLSIGYRTNQVLYVEDGQKYTHTDGRVFQGPAKISLKTSIKEVSLTPIGADSFAKLRSGNTAFNTNIDTLKTENASLRESLDNAYLALKIVSLKK